MLTIIDTISEYHALLMKGKIELMHQSTFNPKIWEIIRSKKETPYVILDLEKVKKNYDLLSELFPAKIYYAVKANPEIRITKLLAEAGSSFDCASLGEIIQVIECGARPEDVAYGNTVKKISHLKSAYDLGVRLFVVDTFEEMEKVAEYAPGSKIYCRIATHGTGAAWPLSAKFGCSVEQAKLILMSSKELGLKPTGISFHVGSQQVDPNQWEPDIRICAEIFSELKEKGIELSLINLGGGFPISYLEQVPDLKSIADQIVGIIDRYFPNRPDLMMEPGRAMVADAGVLVTEVVNFGAKDLEKKEQWLYLDVGRFSGLAETEDEAIKYPLEFPFVEATGVLQTKVAGPTCDSADILYKKFRYRVPANLKSGDIALIHHTGAYTLSYSSVNFNGFPPLGLVII